MLGDNDVARCDVIWRQTRLKRHLPGRLPDDANDSPSFGSDVLQLIPKSRWLITYRVNSVLLVNHGDPPVVRRADRVGLDLRLRGTRHDAQLIVRQLAPERLVALSLSERPEQNCGPFGRTAASKGMLQRAALAIGRVPDDRCSISRERWVNPANRKPITGTGPGCGATANANTGYPRNGSWPMWCFRGQRYFAFGLHQLGARRGGAPQEAAVEEGLEGARQDGAPFLQAGQLLRILNQAAQEGGDGGERLGGGLGLGVRAGHADRRLPRVPRACRDRRQEQRPAGDRLAMPARDRRGGRRCSTSRRRARRRRAASRQGARSCVVKPPQPHWFFISSKMIFPIAPIAIELAERLRRPRRAR